MKAERQVEIARGRKAVWGVLGDPSNLPVWFGDIDEFTAIEGDGTAVGDVYRINYTRFRRPVGLKVTVLEAEAENALLQRFTGLPASFTIALELSGTARKTVLDAEVDVKLSLVQKAFTPLVHGYIDRLAVDLIDGFKNYIEAK